MGDHGAMTALSPDRERLERFLAWEAGVPCGPYTLDISPIMACNLNCLFCRRQDGLEAYYRSQTDLSDEKWLEIVRDAASMGTRRVMVKGGGEPLLRRRLLLKLCEMAEPLGITFSLLTNGTMIDDGLAEAFVDGGWGEIIVSLDGPDAATHDFVRDRPGTFDKVMRSLDRLIRAKARRGRRNPIVQFHTVLTRPVHERLDRFAVLAREKGVGHVGIFPMHGMMPEPLRLSDADLRRVEALRPLIESAFREAGVRYDFHVVVQKAPPIAAAPAAASVAGPMAQPRSLPCYYPWVHASITPFGAIAPCCYGEGHEPEADLHRMSFREAWLGHEMERYRGRMKNGAIMPFCQGCPLWYQEDNARLGELLAAAV